MKKRTPWKAMLSFAMAVMTAMCLIIPSFAAPADDRKCSICNNTFYFRDYIGTTTYQDYYGVEDIQNLTSETGQNYCTNLGDTGLAVTKYNGEYICESCLETIINEYKEANATTRTITTDGGSATIDISVTREAATFSVTLPTSFPVYVSGTGAVTTATDVAIQNNGGAEVFIQKIEIQSGTNWKLNAYDNSIKSLAVNTKSIAWQMTMGGETVATSATGTSEVLAQNTAYYSGGMRIPAGSSLPVTYNAMFPDRNESESMSDTPATVIFTVAWNAA